MNDDASKQTREEIYDLVLDFFDGSIVKTEAWFSTKNPLLGNVSPVYMLIVGREDKLKKFVTTQLELNLPKVYAVMRYGDFDTPYVHKIYDVPIRAQEEANRVGDEAYVEIFRIY